VRSIGNELAQTTESYYEQHDVSVHGRDPPDPFLNFKDAPIPNRTLSQLHQQGMIEPSPIQAVSLPIALSGRDMVGIAQTGSGKTLSYILPGLMHIINKAEKTSRTQALVLAPTRELVQQIQTVANTFTRSEGIRSVGVYGGASVHRQAQEINRGMDMCIATPGRLLQFLESDTIRLSDCSYLVFDEADRMLDMGFEPQIRSVMEYIKCQRQMLMWSATWPDEIKQLAGDFLNDYLEVHIGSNELQASQAIHQEIQLIDGHQKNKAALSLLQGLFERKVAKVLIFTGTKFAAEKLTDLLGRNFRVDCIHGGKSQAQRDRVLNNFRSGSSHVLVATDVAARGLDVDDITHVINYDFPMCVEDYIHRIGRTARWGKTGNAITYFSPQDYKLARELIKVLEQSNQEVSSELRDIAAVNYSGKKNSFRNRFNNNQRDGRPSRQGYSQDFSQREGRHSRQGYSQDFSQRDRRQSRQGYSQDFSYDSGRRFNQRSGESSFSRYSEDPDESYGMQRRG